MWEEMGKNARSFMFRGATKITLDAKGRLAVPVRYRERLHARCEGQLICTVDQDHCLLLYPLPDWEDIERKLMRLPSFDPRNRRLQRMMVGYASEMEMDAAGRVLIPRELREFAGLQKQAVLIGQGSRFELWDDARWGERRDEWLEQGQGDAAELSDALESLSI